MSVSVTDAINAALSLPVNERLDVANAIWDSIAEDSVVELSEQQKKLLDSRLDAFQADPTNVLTWDETLERLKALL